MFILLAAFVGSALGCIVFQTFFGPRFACDDDRCDTCYEEADDAPSASCEERAGKDAPS